ncbi:MAG: hypothetical protein HAW66_04860 [Shewanella sp.]|nr:hypothetical protein [Shewanella sp.]
MSSESPLINSSRPPLPVVPAGTTENIHSEITVNGTNGSSKTYSVSVANDKMEIRKKIDVFFLPTFNVKLTPRSIIFKSESKQVFANMAKECLEQLDESPESDEAITKMKSLMSHYKSRSDFATLFSELPAQQGAQLLVWCNEHKNDLTSKLGKVFRSHLRRLSIDSMIKFLQKTVETRDETTHNLNTFFSELVKRNPQLAKDVSNHLTNVSSIKLFTDLTTRVADFILNNNTIDVSSYVDSQYNPQQVNVLNLVQHQQPNPTLLLNTIMTDSGPNKGIATIGLANLLNIDPIGVTNHIMDSNILDKNEVISQLNTLVSVHSQGYEGVAQKVHNQILTQGDPAASAQYFRGIILDRITTSIDNTNAQKVNEKSNRSDFHNLVGYFSDSNGHHNINTTRLNAFLNNTKIDDFTKKYYLKTLSTEVLTALSQSKVVSNDGKNLINGIKNARSTVQSRAGVVFDSGVKSQSLIQVQAQAPQNVYSVNQHSLRQVNLGVFNSFFD